MNATYNIVTNSKAPVFFGGFDFRKFKSFEVEFYVKYHNQFRLFFLIRRRIVGFDFV